MKIQKIEMSCGAPRGLPAPLTSAGQGARPTNFHLLGQSRKLTATRVLGL